MQLVTLIAPRQWLSSYQWNLFRFSSLQSRSFAKFIFMHHKSTIKQVNEGKKKFFTQFVLLGKLPIANERRKISRKGRNYSKMRNTFYKSNEIKRQRNRSFSKNLKNIKFCFFLFFFIFSIGVAHLDSIAFFFYLRCNLIEFITPVDKKKLE